jgi:hypothetical protein
MIKKSVFEDELIDGMQQNLQEQADQPSDLLEAVDQLNVAAEILEDEGMTIIADDILGVLIKVAKYSIKRREKPHFTSSLERLQGSSGMERMRSNYESHGDPFSRPKVKRRSSAKASDGLLPDSMLADTQSTEDPYTAGLTPEKMVANLEDHGHPLNTADDVHYTENLLELDVGAETLFVDDDIAAASDFED